MKEFLCKEPGGCNLPDELFLIEAKNLDDARDLAMFYNAVVIKEVDNGGQKTNKTRPNGKKGQKV